jgi:hypothetical protein
MSGRRKKPPVVERAYRPDALACERALVSLLRPKARAPRLPLREALTRKQPHDPDFEGAAKWEYTSRRTPL